jgi:hypothetical protein
MATDEMERAVVDVRVPGVDLGEGVHVGQADEAVRSGAGIVHGADTPTFALTRRTEPSPASPHCRGSPGRWASAASYRPPERAARSRPWATTRAPRSRSQSGDGRRRTNRLSHAGIRWSAEPRETRRPRRPHPTAHPHRARPARRSAETCDWCAAASGGRRACTRLARKVRLGDERAYRQHETHGGCQSS